MKIRILSALVSMTFMLLFVPTAMANSEASKIKAGMVVVVNNPDAEDRLNLRTEPRQDAPTLGKYYNGTYPEVLSDEMDGWVKVRIFDLEGYMMAKFLTYPDQLQTGAATVPTVKSRTQAAQVSICVNRSRPAPFPWVCIKMGQRFEYSA